jgi:glycosyltransferase involved in cell wall biosynthesis
MNKEVVAADAQQAGRLRPRKIIRIIARLNVGGPARHVVWLTKGLPEYETLLVAGVVPPGEEDMGYFAAQHGVKPLIMKEMSREIAPRDIITIGKLFQLFRRERPDIVHTHTAKAGTAGRVAGFLYKCLTPSARSCRFIHTYHGHIFHSYYGLWKTRLFLFIEKTLARFATDKIVVISPQQYHEIHEQFGVGRAGQFVVIPLGLDLSAFENYETRRHILRGELGANEETLLIGIVGRLAEVKNHAMFLRAAALVREKYPARFVVIGDGHLRESLKRQTRELGLTDCVHFLGSRDDAGNFYPALDIVALTSLNEGTPLTLIEAMANARPVIATGVGGVIDLLGADEKAGGDFTLCERGLRVASGNAEGFAAGLAYLLDNADLRRSLGENGRSFVLGNYRKERLLQDIRNLYSAISSQE